MIEHSANGVAGLAAGRSIGGSVRKLIAMGLFASVAFPSIVCAQTTGRAVAPAAGAVSGHGTSSPDVTFLEDIIVTAQHREQSLQDVPIAVSAFSGKNLIQSGVQTTEALGQVTPGLNFTRVALFAQPFIRGVGSTTTSLGDESNVATYVDGVYVVQSEAAFYELLNVERVEVLKGPQGTLFGRNATGGAINIITQQPSFDPAMKFRLTYARFNEVSAQGYVTGGLTDSLALSLSGSVGYRDGYIKQRPTGDKIGQRDNYSLQGRMLFKAGDNVTFNLIGTASRTNDPFGLNVRVINRNSLAELPQFGSVNTSMGDYEFLSSEIPKVVLNQHGVALQTDIDLEPFNIASISSYHHIDEVVLVDSDGTDVPLTTIFNTPTARDLQQEIRLTSKAGSPFDWLIGGYYFNGTSGYRPLTVVTAGLNLVSRQKTEAYAFFTDVTVPLLEQFSISAGGRYSHETKTLTQTFSIPAIPGFVVPVPERSVAFNSFTPRAVLSFTPDKRTLIYASYSRGFKSGGLNQAGFGPVSPPAFAPDPAYRPEKLDAYELGVKLTLPNFLQGATFNAALFHYNYKDLQVNVLTPPPAGSGTSVIENAAAVKTTGIDAEFSVRAARGLNLRLGAAYLHARYASFANASVFVPTSSLPGGCAGGIPNCGNTQQTLDVTGNPVVNTPKFTFSGGLDYTFAVGGGFNVVASGNAIYNSGFNWDPIGRVKQGSYVMANAQLELQSPENRFGVAVFVRNLTNERVCSGVGESSQLDYCQYLDPRVIGARLTVNF